MILLKKFLFFLFAFLVLCSLSFPAFASAAEEQGSAGSSSVIVPDVTIINEIDTVEDLGTYVGTSVYAMNPVTPSDTSGLKAVLLEFLGDWDSIVVEHAYQSTNGYTNYVREIQLDYPWLCSAAILAIMIFCLFRLGGAVLCRR